MELKMEVVDFRGHPHPVFPEAFRPLTGLLYGDVQGGDALPWLEPIDAILSGSLQEEELTGNCCTVTIGRESARITDDFSGEECVVPTRKLRELITEWVEVNRQWHR